MAESVDFAQAPVQHPERGQGAGDKIHNLLHSSPWGAGDAPAPARPHHSPMASDTELLSPAARKTPGRLATPVAA